MKKPKKQPWFFRDAENTLSSLRGEWKEELERRELQLLYVVSLETGLIQFWIERLYNDDEVVWSSLRITNIVDFDIALENMQEWFKTSEPKKDQDVSSAPPTPATDALLVSPKATGPQKGLSM